jgi:hypothetical protein
VLEEVEGSLSLLADLGFMGWNVHIARRLGTKGSHARHSGLEGRLYSYIC